MGQGLEGLIRDLVVQELRKEQKNLVPVELSQRHVHMSQEDINSLFGKGYQLNVLRDLSQPGQYACKETVDIVGPKREIHGVRILGPPRKETQVEISTTDARIIGILPFVRLSGDIEGSPGIYVIGPRGAILLNKGVIVAARHLHVNPEEAEKLGLKDKDKVSVRFKGPRTTIFEDCLVRVHPDFHLNMHLDIDEGNAAGLQNGDLGEIVKVIREGRVIRDGVVRS